MTKYLLIAMALFTCTLGLSACNTVDGFGQDLQQAGGAIQKASR